MLDGKFLAKITAYRGFLVIEGVGLDFVHERWIPAGDGKIGCIVGDTANFLGVSPEALQLLKSMKKGRDAIGDTMWWEASDGKDYFGWIGSNLRIVDPAEAEADRDYGVREYVEIQNDVPPGAVECIDKEEEESMS